MEYKCFDKFTLYNVAMSYSNKPPLPPVFLQRMNNFLAGEFSDFEQAMQQPAVSGLRVNTLKLSVDEFINIAPGPLGERIPWAESAFQLPESDFRFGSHPYHQAGLYYLQDPSAMSPAEMLFSQPMRGDETVLDLAAAPGGKTTHLAALMNGRGLLVANEIKDKRVGHLIQNMDRWGALNVIITNETPERLADHFGAYFDRVLVDAPCSGEGMFRKDMGARVDWSVDMLQGCAVRQGNILRVAAKLVKSGGYLLYSTCTFAPEEDEAVITQLIKEFPDFSVVSLPQRPGFMPGRPDWLENPTNEDQQLAGAVRLFPHRLAGEGHFACLLQRAEGGQHTHTSPNRLAEPTRTQLGYWQEFAENVLNIDLAEDRLRLMGERLYYLPDHAPDFGRLRTPQPGVWLGFLKKDRFEPAHPLALSLQANQINTILNLEAGSSELAAYLRGETLQSDGLKGWLVVAVDGWPLGWGKRVQSTVKNHYPRGWM